jgi:CRP-like cAMP-binding protein
LVLRGRVAIIGGSPSVAIGTVRAGETCGEVSLLSARPHSATATTDGPVEAAELLQRDLADLIRRRPDIGVIIYRNLAIGLGDKLSRSSLARLEHGLVAADRLHQAAEGDRGKP